MGTLFIVSTPIGNLGDISSRAIQTLNNSDLILCEDTRTSGIILSKLKIKKPLLSLHDNNEEIRIPQVLEALAENKNISLISESGTPLISDPGYKLVREVIKEGFRASCIPGPSSVITSLVISGLPPDKFFFLGFLPKKENQLRVLARKLKSAWEIINFTVLSFESPFRVNKSLKILVEEFPDSYFVIARELTKIHEEIVRGQGEEIIAKLKNSTLKGEITLLINPKNPFKNY